MKILSEFIKTAKYELTKKDKKPSNFEETKLPSTITDSSNWRPLGLHYKKNEVFLDVIEKVNIDIFDFQFDKKRGDRGSNNEMLPFWHAGAEVRAE